MKCTACQYAIQYLSSQIEAEKTEKTIELAIGSVCKISPNSYKTYCNEVVDRHGRKLIQFIEKYTDPVNVCASIKMCHVEPQAKAQAKSNIQDKSDKKSVFELSSSSKLEAIESSNDESPFDGNKIVAKNDTFECSLCLYVSELVDNLLKANKTEQQIVAELERVCGLMPKPLKDQVNKKFLALNPSNTNYLFYII
jgi:hypothetical protein